MTDQTTPKPRPISTYPVPEDSSAIFKAALERVIAELAELKTKKEDIIARELQLNETYKALLPLAGDLIPNVATWTLANAIRLIFNGLPDGKTLTAIGVRDKLEDLGYDLSKYENPLASIHTCVRRMLDSEELMPGRDDKKKELEPGPKLKSVAETTENKPSLAERIEAKDK